MSCIHYKFSNTVENDKIKFDGLHISVADLREAIIKQKGLKSNQYTLKIIDSQTKKGKSPFPVFRAKQQWVTLPHPFTVGGNGGFKPCFSLSLRVFRCQGDVAKEHVYYCQQGASSECSESAQSKVRNHTLSASQPVSGKTTSYSIVFSCLEWPPPIAWLDWSPPIS